MPRVYHVEYKIRVITKKGSKGNYGYTETKAEANKYANQLRKRNRKSHEFRSVRVVKVR